MEGSCRVQDWCQVHPHDKSLAPGASAVYRIAITKNGERNTLFAVGSEGIFGDIAWRLDFDNMLREHGPTPAISTMNYSDTSCNIIPGSKLDSKQFASRMQALTWYCAQRCGNYTRKDLKDLHITPHSLHGTFAAFGEAMEWDTIPVHRLGRWKLPISQASVVPVSKRKGAGAGGARTIAAVYSTAASCQIQLKLRMRVVSAIRAIGSDFSTHGDLSCFTANRRLIALGFRGPMGHEPQHATSVAAGIPVATVE
jgi:hypothetical protein